MNISTMEYYSVIKRHEILLQLGKSPKHIPKKTGCDTKENTLYDSIYLKF